MEEYEQEYNPLTIADEFTRVKIIARKSGMSLVEYLDEDEKLQRVYVPTDSIYEYDDGTTRSDAVQYGSPYGVPWAEMVTEELVLNPELLERELRRYGVWTYQDFVQSPEAVRAAFNQALRDLYGTVRANALQFESSEGV